jgi:hypothetical protein
MTIKELIDKLQEIVEDKPEVLEYDFRANVYDNSSVLINEYHKTKELEFEN